MANIPAAVVERLPWIVSEARKGPHRLQNVCHTTRPFCDASDHLSAVESAWRANLYWYQSDDAMLQQLRSDRCSFRPHLALRLGFSIEPYSYRPACGLCRATTDRLSK